MQIHAVTIDPLNPQQLAAWWSNALGINIGADYEQIVQLEATPHFPLFQFQKIEDVPVQRNRVHVDFRTSDLDAEITKLVNLGASHLQTYDLPSIRYASLADLDGNKFDVVQS